jgi:hypothetical protein
VLEPGLGEPASAMARRIAPDVALYQLLIQTCCELRDRTRRSNGRSSVAHPVNERRVFRVRTRGKARIVLAWGFRTLMRCVSRLRT